MDNNEQNIMNEEELEQVAGGARSAYIYYKVVRGDTLTKLAHRYRTTVEVICDLNPIIQDPNFIREGWVLKIPRNI